MIQLGLLSSEVPCDAGKSVLRMRPELYGFGATAHDVIIPSWVRRKCSSMDLCWAGFGLACKLDPGS